MAIEKYTEVAEKINELTSTMSEAFEHIINVQISELRFEDSFYLLKDIIDAFFSIYSAINIIKNEFDINEVLIKGNQFQNELEKLLGLYENKEYECIVEEYKNGVIPAYRMWKESLNKNILSKYKN